MQAGPVFKTPLAEMPMQMLMKLVMTVVIVLVATAIGRKLPATAGLIAVMPLAGAMVLVWVYLDSQRNPATMEKFAVGALWGMLPSILFYVVALYGFRRHLSLPVVLALGFGVWLCAAGVLQRMLK